MNEIRKSVLAAFDKSEPRSTEEVAKALHPGAYFEEDLPGIQRIVWSLHKSGHLVKHGVTKGVKWTLAPSTAELKKDPIILSGQKGTGKTSIHMVGIMRGCGRAFAMIDGVLCYVTPHYGSGPHAVDADMSPEVNSAVLAKEGFEEVSEKFDSFDDLYECLIADWKKLRPIDGCDKYVMTDPFDVLDGMSPAVFALFVEEVHRDDYRTEKWDQVRVLAREALERNIGLEDMVVYGMLADMLAVASAPCNTQK